MVLAQFHGGVAPSNAVGEDYERVEYSCQSLRTDRQDDHS